MQELNGHSTHQYTTCIGSWFLLTWGTYSLVTSFQKKQLARCDFWWLSQLKSSDFGMVAASRYSFPCKIHQTMTSDSVMPLGFQSYLLSTRDSYLYFEKIWVNAVEESDTYEHLRTFKIHSYSNTPNALNVKNIFIFRHWF